MERRTFLRNTALAGLSMTSISIISCNIGSKPRKKDESNNNQFQLNEITILELQEKVKNGDLTYSAIVQMYISRIKAIDKTDPELNSVIELNPDALSIAQMMDEERKLGKWRGLMHGIPVLIKDNIDTADKMQTTAGSLALEGHIALKDAFLVSKLRAAGAVILGKTNLSEWANFRSTRSVSGWSSRGGQTKNPYILDRTPCGSSSGSAVAASANLCAVAVGTETDGSIACPASMNGLVGIKPTVGLVSRTGIIPISKSQDTAGPLARTVTDAVVLLNAMTGPDTKDDATLKEHAIIADYTKFLETDGLKGKRIGIEKSLLKHHEGVDKILRTALDQMEKAGATIVEVEFLAKASELGGAEFEMMEYEFKDGLNKYLSSANSKVKSLKDIIDFNNRNEAKVMPYFKQEIMDSAEIRGNLESKSYLEALQKLQKLRVYLDDLFSNQQLNAICGPATGTAWCTDPINGDFWTGYGAYGPAAITGYPCISVPMGFIDELPVGLSFIGKKFAEPEIIPIAYAYEQISKNRRPPKFLKTLEYK